MSEEINTQIANVPRFRNRQEAIAYMERYLPTLPDQDKPRATQVIEWLKEGTHAAD